MIKKEFRNIALLILSGLLSFISCGTGDNFNYLPQKLGDLSLTNVIQNKKWPRNGKNGKGHDHTNRY